MKRKLIVILIVVAAAVVVLLITNTFKVLVGLLVLLALIGLGALVVAGICTLGDLGGRLINEVAEVKRIGWRIFLGLPLTIVFVYLFHILAKLFFDPKGFLFPATIFATIFFFLGYYARAFDSHL